MKLLIFGATGGTGRHLVEQALTQGHTVTAFTRNHARLVSTDPNLSVVQGDVLDLASVRSATGGQEAVLAVLGTPIRKEGTVRSEGTRNIIRAMEEAGVRRLIAQSTVGAGDSRPMLPFQYKYILVPFLLREAFAEHERQEEYIRRSRLDWTIVRPGVLTNGDRTGEYRHGLAVDKIKTRITRADVADFTLKQLQDDRYLHQTPWVSG
jgi:putative NADH-flavin reductase